MRTFLNAVITKVDEVKQEVTGCLAEEVVDKTDELFDYATSKAYFEKWNADFAEKTAGKSVGNLRAMHKSVAAGKFVEMSYDDEAKKIYVVAKVTVPEQWEQVVEGVYTGFSIGAHVIGKKWKDAATGAWRYTADPFEGSLVDNPCMYGANFTSVKADGETLKVFKGGVAKKTPENVASLLAEAMSAVVALDVDEDAAKGLYTVSWFAQICASLNDLADCTLYEAEVEGDGSAIPDEIRATAKKLGELLVAYVTEEVAEEAAERGTEEVIVEMSAKNKVIREAGERPVKPLEEAGIRPVRKLEEESPAPVPAVEAPAVEAPVVEEPAAPAAAVETPAVEEGKEKVTLSVSPSVAKYLIGKVVLEKSEHDALIAKALKVDSLLTENADLNESNIALTKAIEELAKTPAPTAVKLKGIVVEKSADGSRDIAGEGEEEGTVKTAKNPLDAIKAIHKGRK